MKILAIDTSTATCTVGLVDGDDVLAESADQSGRTHARHVMALVDDTLKNAGMAPESVDGFGVINGPGTFTGLRIGISTVQGLAYALNRPVAGITSLNALAAQAKTPLKRICPMVDARRREVYYGLYELRDGGLKQIVPHQVASPARVLEQIHEPCHFIGTGARLYRQLIADTLGPLAGLASEDMDSIRSAVIAKLAREFFQTADNHQLTGVSPCYIRRSDAEINAGRATVQ